MRFNNVPCTFVGVEAEGGELLLAGGGQILEVVDGFKGAGEEGGRAEVEGVAGMVDVVLETADGDVVGGGLFGGDVGEKAGGRGSPEKLVDKEGRFFILGKDNEGLFFLEMEGCGGCQARELGAAGADLKEDDASLGGVRDVHR